MRILPINTVQPSCKSEFSYILENPEFKLFMKELDSLTSKELDEIHQKYVSGTKAKEDAIEALFNRREAIIKRKKAELQIKVENHKNWFDRIFGKIN